MKSWVQRRIDAWTLRRVRRQRVTVVLRHRIYILPTRFGWGFSLMTLLMLVGATNYSNSMAFALTFLLASLGLVCMHHTHANLVNVQAQPGQVDAVFAGEKLRFELRLDNLSARTRHDLQLGWQRQAAQSKGDVAPASPQVLSVLADTQRRGWQRCGVLRLSSEFPLGLFRAWTLIEPEWSGLVYPKPVDAGVQPQSSGGHDGEASGSNQGQDDFAGLRPYRVGDSLRTMHWKSVSKGQAPMVKLFSDTASPELWLEWNSLPQLDTEARLSQLARWVLDAQAARARFGLRLPGVELAPAQGDAHVHACLSALATFDSGASA